MKKLILFGMVSIAMFIGMVMIASCDGGSSCAADYGCNSSSSYCGRSTCDAKYVGDRCDC